MGSGGRSLPVAFQAVGANGQAHRQDADPDRGRGPPAELHHRDLTLTRQREAAAAVQQAAQTGTLPQRVGTPVLRGALR